MAERFNSCICYRLIAAQNLQAATRMAKQDGLKNLSTLFQSLMLGAAFFVHHKIYYVQALAVGFTVGAKAIGCMGFVIDLQAWCFVFVEGAMQSQVLVRF